MMPEMDIKAKIRRISQPTVVCGDIAAQRVEAIVVPHFYNQDKWGLVTVSRDCMIENRAKSGKFPKNRFANVVVAWTGTSEARYQFHVFPRASGLEERPAIAYAAVHHIINMVSKFGLKSIAFPVLGMGIMSGLNPKQCAVILGAAIYNSRAMDDIRLVVPGDKYSNDEIVQDVRDVIQSVRMPGIATDINAMSSVKRTQMLSSNLLNTFARICY